MQITKQKKLIISILIALVLLVGVLMLVPKVKSAKAEKLESYDNFNFTQITNDDGEKEYKIAIKPAYRSTVEFVVIPETYEGLPVTEIAANGFLSCTKLTKVIMTATVKTIGNNAFMNCSKLKSIILPSVQSIGNNAFASCASLDRLYIPDSVTAVGSTILRNNPNTVFIQSSTEVVNTLWSSTWSNYFTGEIVTEANVSDVINYREILATDNQTVIGYEIAGEQSIGAATSDLIIYNSVCIDEEIGYLPVLNICSDAFFGVTVNSITIKDRHEDNPEAPSFTHKINLRSSAFAMTFVQEINFEIGITLNHPENLQLDHDESWCDFEPIVGDSDGFSMKVFKESTVQSISLPSDIELITESMFYNCAFLEFIKIDGAENNATNTLPNVERIGAEAFCTCTSLKNITIPASVSYVGEAAFSNLGENIDEQIIYVDMYEDEIQGWDSNWAVDNKDNVEISFKPLTYITVILYKEKTINIGVKPGRVVPDLKETIERKGYNFKGIYSSEEDGGYQYYNLQYKGARIWNVGDPETLYVNWEIIHYNITYIPDLKELGITNPATYTVEDEFTFNTPKKVGYTFVWEPAGISKDTTEDITVYGHWEIIHYNITYVPSLEELGITNRTTYTVEDEFTFNTPEKPGYTFVWEPSGISEGMTGDITVNGSWTKNKYNIYYDVDLKGLTNPNPTSYDVDTEVNFIKLEKAGYTFEWIPAKIEKGNTCDITVKGTWAIIKYTITYDVLEGTEINNPLEYDVEHHVTFEPATYDGYIVTWNMVSTNGCTGNLTVTATYTDILASCYNSSTERFEIYTAANLDLLRSARTENKTYYVEVNYNNNLWTPIQEFKGTLTGKVTGIRMYPSANSTHYGFILRNSGTITNFTLDGTLEVTNIHSNRNVRYIGLLCGANYGKIIQCTVKSSSPITRQMDNGEYGSFGLINKVDTNVWLGGLVGSNSNIIYNCNNRLNIYTYSNVGGIACQTSGKITGAINFGTIRFFNSGSKAGRIGGIVCFASDEVISGCFNHGDIYYMSNIVEPSLDFQPSIGGIAGELDALSWAAVENCNNFGTIYTGNLYGNQLAHVDGLIGYIWDED